ncbi:MAG: hypothetical protein GTN93_02970, partial [Anaerolineae bacterium]|nr:hypothetical protein [Anaerolineae bacterium]
MVSGIRKGLLWLFERDHNDELPIAIARFYERYHQAPGDLHVHSDTLRKRFGGAVKWGPHVLIEDINVPEDHVWIPISGGI